MRSDELHPYGTYAELVPDQDTRQMLVKLIEAMGIANPIDPDKIHTTVIYSKKPCPNAMSFHGAETPYQGRISGLQRWPTQAGPTCLVALVECDEASKLHHHIMDTYGATYDFPEYTPHFTLSYDCGDGEHELPNGEHPVKYANLHVKALDPKWEA